MSQGTLSQSGRSSKLGFKPKTTINEEDTIS